MNDDERVIWPDIDILMDNFSYQIPPSEKHKRLLELFEDYRVNSEKFHKKGYKEAGKRARKNLIEIGKLLRPARAEILHHYKNKWENAPY